MDREIKDSCTSRKIIKKTKEENEKKWMSHKKYDPKKSLREMAQTVDHMMNP